MKKYLFLTIKIDILIFLTFKKIIKAIKYSKNINIPEILMLIRNAVDEAK